MILLKSSGSDILKGIRKAKGGLREKILLLTSYLDSKISKLDYMIRRIQEKDRQLYEMVVEAQARGDMEKARIYAREIAEVRRIASRLIKAQTILEQVKLRVETVNEIGELISVIQYLRPILKEVQAYIGDMLPELAFDMDYLNTLMMEAAAPLLVSTSATSYTIHHLDPEAERILEEAAALAEARMNNKFPKVKR